ncbi:MAG: FecR domain-containing protein [Lewinellaceae bacterium]|nr:FecR domain-containing protein [Phaeodactylibacter sp.]MCB9035222.1 FecR domain-containing protein [Lewinellaceae bacterium]
MEEHYNDIEAVIIKSLEGQASAAEGQMLEDWLREGDKHRRQYQEVKALWEAAGDTDFGLDPDTGRQWEELASKLAGAARDGGARVLRFQNWRFAAAALVFAGLLGLVVFYFSGGGGPAIAQEFSVPAGERQDVQLPDGTLVALNAASQLQVLKGFNEKERRLRLRGEGYFQVSSGAQKPFIIETEGAQVQVTGTAFNVKAYPESAAVRLTVTEGSVRFSIPQGAALLPVTAGNAAEMDKTSGKIRKIPFDERATAWRNGSLVFDDTPWEEVVRSLERAYAVEISDETSLQDRRYSALFDNQTLEECLQVMQATLGFDIERKGGQLILK